MAEVKYEYYNTGDDNASAAADTNWLAQTFTPASDQIIDKIKIKIYTNGSPGDLTVEIYPTDGNDRPSTGGDPLASGTIAEADIPTGPSFASSDWVDVDLGFGVELTTGIIYAIVIHCPGGGIGDDVGWNYDNNDATYTRGEKHTSANGGTNWALLVNDDQMFETWGHVEGEGGFRPVDLIYSKKLVTIAGNELWYESSVGTMVQLAASAASGQLDCTEPLSMFEAYGKVFIVNGSRKKVFDPTNTKIETSDLGENPPDHGNILTGNAGAKIVVDYITNLDDNETCVIYGRKITTTVFVDGEAVTGTDNDENAIAFDIKGGTTEVAPDPPHWYDWTPYGDADDSHTTYGKMPNKPSIGCNYQGRAVISGDPENPHQWYMARQENPFDFIYGINDAQSAVAGNNADAGEIGDIVRTLIPHKDDYLVFGCVSSIWYMAGNPCEGGPIIELSLTTGIFGPLAWCMDIEDTLYFWGTNGLYKCTVPSKPICISSIRLPDLVNDEAADPSTHRIGLHYDRRQMGIVITVTKISDGSNSNYWYDLRNLDDSGIGGFFPEVYPNNYGIFSSCEYETIDPDYRKLFFGCNDGYIRIFDTSSKDDDGTKIDSYVVFGPLPMSTNPKLTGKLTGLNVITAGGGIGGSQSDSDDIYFKVFITNVAEQILEKLYVGTNPNISGTIKAPGRYRGSNIKRKLKGLFMGVKIGNNTVGETWAFEQLLYYIKNAGRLK